MTTPPRFSILAMLLPLLVCSCASPKISSIDSAMQRFVNSHDMSGAVTVVVTKDKTLHLSAIGLANIAKQEPMRTDSLFWIASMTKPITATAILMLQDSGQLKVSDPVAKYIPTFAGLKTPSGKPADLTIAQLMTHTSGLGEANRNAENSAHTLADMIPIYLSTPMQYEPGSQWKYTQSGINTAARIVEVVSGMTFDSFVTQRILQPLGMKDTTFYPATRPSAHRVVGYTKNKTTGVLEPQPAPAFGEVGHPPFGNGGLYSTGPDYARFCQMLLGNGVFEGRRLLSPEAMTYLKTVQTGDLPTGFIDGHGKNYGWGIGTCIVREPHPGVADVLSPGTFGHGGAWGTQAWVDPVRGVAYIMMVQRPNSGNSDASEVRQAFQEAAAASLFNPGT